MSEFAPCVSLMAEGLWREISSDSNARFAEPLRPDDKAHHFIYIGSGFAGEVEAWATVPITPTEELSIDGDYATLKVP